MKIRGTLSADTIDLTDAFVKAAITVANATGGASSGSKQCTVIGSNSDAAAWSA